MISKADLGSSDSVAGTMPDSDSSAAARRLFDGGGEMGERMRALDWSQTAVGPVETWPQSLRTVVRIMLTSRYAMWMGWGPELSFFYNDTYLPTLGVKQPWALGAPARKVWAEIWHDVGPRAEAVLQTGVATWDEALLLFLERSGFVEETYHTFSYSPIPDDRGAIGGLLCVVTEETNRTIDERRLTLLRGLAADLSGTQTEELVCAGITHSLGSQPRDVPFTLTYLFAEDRRTARLACATGVIPDSSDAPLVLNLSDGRWPAPGLLVAGAQIVVDDLIVPCGAMPAGPLDKPARQAVVMPLGQQGRSEPVGFFVLGLNPYRPLDTAYRGFIALLAGQVAAGLANARAYEQERKRAEALAALDHAKTTFFSNVSHEFRTPLTLILGPLEDALVDAVAVLPAVQHERVVTAHRNSLRLLKLVNTLLDFSRIEADRMKATYEPTALGPFTSELASNFRSASERAGLQLIVHCADLGELVYVDRDLWEKIVLNLLSNAFKFTLQGQIHVTLRRAGAHIELAVQDTGIGIAESELPHLFERFHRVEDARGRSQEGTGIGLALVLELVKLHGGAIRVQSVVDRGSTFTVTLPLGTAHLPAERVQAPRASAATPTRSARAYINEALRWVPEDAAAGAKLASELPLSRPPVDNKRARILLADDNADMRDYVRRLLEPQYEVVTAIDGQEALNRAVVSRPDLILTDVMMPNLDGFGLLKAVRADARTAATPVILLSARAGEEARLEGNAAGADDYLVKPFSARELIARISGTLALSQARRQIVRREEELKAEKATVLESMQEAFVALDATGCFTYVNAQAERIYNMARKDLVGKNLCEVFTNSADTPIGHAYRRAMAERRTLRIEEYYKPFASWFEVSVYPLRDGGVGAYFRDISERKRTEAMVIGQKQALELEINNATLEQVLTVLTHTVEAQSGENVLAAIQLLDADGQHLRPGAAPHLPADYYRALDGLRIGPNAGSCGTAAYTRQTVAVSDTQTDPRWAELRLLALSHGLLACWSTPLFSSRGKVLGTFALYYAAPRSPAPSDREVVDILAHTASLVLERRIEMRERREAEAALRDNERRYRQLVDSLPAAVYTCDASGYVTLYNDAAVALWGWRPELGKQLWCGAVRMYRPDGTDLPPDQRPMSVALKDGRALPATEVVIARPDGSRRHVLAHPEPIRDHTGTVTGALNILIDITDRKQAEDALKEADRRKDEFLATLAHELRNPLAPLRNGLELLRMTQSVNAAAERVYGMMERQVNHLVRLVDDLLEISRITRGKIELRLEDVDLAEVLRSAIESSRPLIADAEHELTVALPGVPLLVRADPVRLSQVIANLLNNAAKYTPKRGHIWLQAEPHGDEVRITVRDNGVGIPADMLPRVFELFTQVDRTQKQSQGGLGIGLALVRSLLALHHGRVEAHSAGAACGSEFVVYLPQLSPLQRPDPEPSPQPSSVELPRQLRIVVVDDNRDIADSLSMMLRIFGNEVYTAYDGPSGLAAVLQYVPEVVLADIGMPGMDGYEVARQVRQNEKLRSITLIAVTGWGQAGDKLAAKQAGFDHHLVKPVKMPVLEALLSSIVKRS